MLTNLTLENFKAFQKLDDLKIKPITILCGTNSCGKSSILQSILLLKQTLESKNPNENLLLNGYLTKLGLFQDTIFRKKLENALTIDISFKPNKNKYRILTSFRDMLSNFKSVSNHVNIEKCEIRFSVSLEIYDEDNEMINYVKKYRVKKISATINELDKDIRDSGASIQISHSEDTKYLVRWLENGEVHLDEEVEEMGFGNIFPTILIYPRLRESRFKDYYPSIVDTFQSLKELIQAVLQSYTYIGPLRESPANRYIYEDEVIGIGTKGENAAYLYYTGKQKSIGNHYFLDLMNQNFEKTSDHTLHSALKKWFEIMGIPNFEAEMNDRIIYLNMNAGHYDETRVGIADAGFGISQIFPIILEGLRMERGNTLILEQPEIHLHPNLQMQMADYFISLALSGKSVLVETHSDHVINRLVRRIVEDETHNLQDLIGIYFIKPSENGSVYEEVKIDETKGIVNWPPDFFDQTANEQMKIMQAGLKKRKNQRIPANGNAS